MAWGYGGHAVVSTTTFAPRQDENLSNYNRNSYWELDVTVSGRSYALFFDTGSSDLWIQDSDFIPSSTFVLDPDSNFNISYLDGSTANGPVGNDTVSFSGLTVTQQLIAVPNSLSGFDGTGIIGIIGMSYPAITSLYSGADVNADNPSTRVLYSSIVNTIFNIQQLTAPLFSVALSRSSTTATVFGGVLTMGGIASFTDPAVNVTGSLVTVPNASPQTQYDIRIDGINYAGGAAQDVGGIYLLDTGTTLVYTTAEVADDVAMRYDPPGVWDATNSVFWTSCAAVPPSFSVTIGGQAFPINPVDLLYGDVGNPVASCSIPIAVGTSKVLGGVFLQNVLAVFDWGTEQISLGSREYYSTA